MSDAYLPHPARVVERIQETPTVFTLRLELMDPQAREAYVFHPGQFNMVYLPGAGEVPISIVSDPQDPHLLDHTIRAVGRVTHGLARLRAGDQIGLRGPYGRGWPLGDLHGRDVVILTGGLGCAPVVGAIRYVLRRRRHYGRLVIMQGVKHPDDLLWRRQYEAWAAQPDTQVLLAADQAAKGGWPWYTGRILDLVDEADFDTRRCAVLLCGPEPMMVAGVRVFLDRGVPAEALWLSMERNMQCALGHCGHCQYGPDFVCRQGPVFCYHDIRDRLGRRGY